MIVFIDNFGAIVDEENKAYKVILTGGYEWSHINKAWWHDIESIEPHIPLSRLLSTKLLIEQ